MFISRTTCSRCAARLQRLSASTAHPKSGSRTDPTSSTRSNSTLPTSVRQASSQDNRSRIFGHPLRLNHPPVGPPSSSEDPAIALFNSVVKRGLSPAQGVSENSLSEWELAAKLKQLYEEHITDLDQSIATFQQEILPHLLPLSGRLPRHLYILVTQYLGAVADTVIKTGDSSRALDLLELNNKFCKSDLDLRNALVLSLCAKIIKEGPGPDGILVQQLLGLWKRITQEKRLSQDGKPPQLVLPEQSEVLEEIERLQSDAGQHELFNLSTTRRLASLFPQYLETQSPKLVPGLIATLAILTDSELVDDKIRAVAAPLTRLAAVALRRKRGNIEGNVQPAFFQTSGNRVSESWFPRARLLPLWDNYVSSQWGTTTVHLQQLVNIQRPSNRSHTEGSVSSRGSAKISAIHKQLRTAYRARNTAAILAIWQDLKTKLEHQQGFGTKLSGEPEFLDYWLFVWCAIRRHTQVQETLQFMGKLNVQPTVKTYTSMMHGWKLCKDGDKIEALWIQLSQSSFRLDSHIWTERISGLVEAGRQQAALEALGEMMARWKQAEKDGLEASAVRPTIEVVNAALKSLISRDSLAARELLNWAGRHGLEPNVRTYNILLRESFRSQFDNDVNKILEAMKLHGVDPDAATFTIILEEVLGNMRDATPEEQVKAVGQILKDIELAGLEPNLETYGKMLYAVASLANGADEAVAAVQTCMRLKGLQVTPHMITILIERSLDRNPNDTAPIKTILREHGLTNVNQGDSTLWERVMSAYAVTGATDEAMNIFNALTDKGQSMAALPCLTDLLKSLLHADKVGDATLVVKTVLKSKITEDDTAGSLTGPSDRYWKHHFWYLAQQHGLLDTEIPPQLARSR